MLDFTLYPVRPERQQGESLTGFIYRFLGMNGHRIDNALLNTLDTLYRSDDGTYREVAWQVICKIINDEPEEYRRLWMAQRYLLPVSAARQQRRYWQRVAKYHLRLCPLCLKESGVHLAIWDLPLVEACPIHRCELASRCDCGEPLTWKMVEIGWICKCGRVLPELISHPASRERLNLAVAIAAVSDLHVPGLSEVPTQELRIAADLGQAYSVVTWLQKVIRFIPENNKPLFQGEAASVWRLGRFIEEWPHGLEKRLIRLLRFRCRSEKRWYFILLDPQNPTKRLLDSLALASPNSGLPSSLVDAVQRVLEHTLAPIGEGGQLIVNPCLDQLERHRQIAALRHWWPGLAEWTNEYEEDDASPTHFPDIDTKDIDERARARILNLLIDAAVKNTEPIRFKRFAQAWPDPSFVPSDASHEEFLGQLYGQLKAISSANLHYLEERALLAGGHARNDFL